MGMRMASTGHEWGGVMGVFGAPDELVKERENGQDFFVDIELAADLRKAGMSDDIEDTVDYSGIYNIINSIMKSNRFKLIERVAETIAREIMSRNVRARMVRVTVRKPDPPLPGELDCVGVEIERSLSDY